MKSLAKLIVFLTVAGAIIVTEAATAFQWQATVTYENRELVSKPTDGVHRLYLPKTRWVCHVEAEIVKEADVSSTRFLSCELPNAKDRLRFPVACHPAIGVNQSKINLVDNRGRQFSIRVACDSAVKPKTDEVAKPTVEESIEESSQKPEAPQTEVTEEQASQPEPETAQKQTSKENIEKESVKAEEQPKAIAVTPEEEKKEEQKKAPTQE